MKFREPLPHHTEPERVVDEWAAGGLRYRLMERADVFRLEVLDDFRWRICERGLQAVARRVAELMRPEEKVMPIIRRVR